MNRLFAALGLAAGALVSSAQAQNIPTIRVGWTIPAEEAKYWMMRRPQEFPDLGKTYKIEWSQFQGTSVMSQALIAGALDCATQGILPVAQGAAAGTLPVYIVAEHVGEKPGSFSVYWAVKDDSSQTRGYNVGAYLPRRKITSRWATSRPKRRSLSALALSRNNQNLFKFLNNNSCKMIGNSLKATHIFHLSHQ